MTDEAWAELMDFIEQIEKSAVEFRKRGRKARNYPDQHFNHATAAAYEATSIWLRGFIGRHGKLYREENER